jgi:hypothetical protein
MSDSAAATGTPTSSARKIRTPKKLYSWELDHTEKDETPAERSIRLAQKDNVHTKEIEGSFKPDLDFEGFYVKSDGAPNPLFVDVRIKLNAAEYEELLARKKMADQVKKHKKRFAKKTLDKENGAPDPSQVHSVLPYVDRATIEKSLYRK